MSRGLRSFISFLIGSTILVALPIVAWGLADVRGFIGDPARLGYVAAVCLLNAFAAFRIPEVGRALERVKTAVPRQHLATQLLKALCLSIAMVAPFCDRRNMAVLPEHDVIRFVGVSLYGLGFLLMHFAQVSLGRQFSLEVAIQRDHALVTEGLYRHLRHPRYLGIIAFSVGISLVFRSWIALGLSAAIVATLLWRMHDEEALMHREFGPDWEAYCRRSWRLVPFIF